MSFVNSCQSLVLMQHHYPAKTMTTSNILQLLIPLREIEHLTELEVGEVFVSRTYRTSALKRPMPLLNFCAKQLLAVGLVWMVGMIPVGRWMEGNYGPIDENQQAFVAINSSIDLTVITGWDYLRVGLKHMD